MENTFATILPIMLLVMVLVPAVSLFFLRSLARSPIAIIMSIAKGLLRESRGLEAVKSETLANDSDITNLRIAEKYFETLERELQKETKSQNEFLQKKIKERDSVKTPYSQTQSSAVYSFFLRFFYRIVPFLSNLFQFLLIVGGTVLGGTLALALLQYFFLHITDILQDLFAIAPYLLLNSSGLLLIWLLSRLFNHSQPVLEYAYGSTYFDSSYWSLHEATMQHRQVCLMLNEVDQQRSPQTEIAIDPDLSPLEIQNAPLIPGVTEIVLSHEDFGIDLMRKRLNLVGVFHWRLAIVSSVAFFLALGASLYTTLFVESKAYASIFGGLGLGVVLGTFTFFTLKNVRTANIAISLFDSYLIELKTSLQAADRIADPVLLAKAKAKSWLEFRRGLNALWKTERAEKPAVRK